MWARQVLSPVILPSVSSVTSCCRVTWCCSGVRRVVYSAGVALSPHCRCLSARLTGIDYTVCMHVLQAHDGPDVRCLGNVRACVGNMHA
jgi:hypothetical protein